jgi:hypothetical protein
VIALVVDKHASLCSLCNSWDQYLGAEGLTFLTIWHACDTPSSRWIFQQKQSPQHDIGTALSFWPFDKHENWMSIHLNGVCKIDFIKSPEAVNKLSKDVIYLNPDIASLKFQIRKLQEFTDVWLRNLGHQPQGSLSSTVGPQIHKAVVGTIKAAFHHEPIRSYTEAVQSRARLLLHQLRTLLMKGSSWWPIRMTILPNNVKK